MLKKSFICLLFVVLNFLSVSSQVLYQAFLFNGNDTLTMWRTFITTPYSNSTLEITSNDEDMSFATCFSGEYFPIWRIENDSMFLIQLIDNTDRNKTITVDLKTQFKDRCINNRVFAFQLSYQIEANIYSNNRELFRESIYCFTIKNGKVTDKGIFKDKTQYIDESSYTSEESIQSNTNWANLPPIEVDRLVTIKITTNNYGKITDAIVVKNSQIPTFSDNIIRVEGEEVWQKEALRQVKLIPKWNIIYKCGQVVHQEESIEFLFKKPQ